jgi:tetratricopeptide (TPR) repeat protein
MPKSAFRRSVEIRPTSGQALTALGGILLDKTEYEEAVRVLKEAVARTPWSSEALYFLGSALFKLSQLPEAESSLHESLNQDHPRHDARLMLVNIFIKQRRYPEALDQLSEYVKAVPDSPQRKAIEQLQMQIQSVLKPPPGDRLR